VCRHMRGSNWGRYSVDSRHKLLCATCESTASHPAATHRQTALSRLRNLGISAVKPTWCTFYSIY
jgi:hypothetical protein